MNTQDNSTVESSSTLISPPCHPTTAIRSRPNPKLQEKIARMRLSLAPIYPLPTGPPHPHFPLTLLHYHLLTDAQLDALAAYYHQASPSDPWHAHYPMCMNWDKDFLQSLTHEERLAIKRRMFGKFIGLRGCETPVEEFEKRVRFLEEKIAREVRREREDGMAVPALSPAQVTVL